MKDIREDPGTLKAIQLLVSLWVIGQIILTLSYARAESVSAKCTLEVDGSRIWDGKCCVEHSAMDDGAEDFLLNCAQKACGAVITRGDILNKTPCRHLNENASARGFLLSQYLQGLMHPRRNLQGPV